MNKGTKIALGVMGILLVACLAGLIGMINDAGKTLQKERDNSVVEANEVLILAAGSWNYDDIALRTSAEFMPAEEAKAKFAQWQEEYGNLVSGDMKLVTFNITDKQFNDTTLVSTFETVAEFANKKGKVRMTLTRKPRNAWELASLEVSEP